MLEGPSAILKIESELLFDEPGKLQRLITKTISILRLFKVGSIYYTGYQMNSESILGLMGGTLHTIREPLNLEISTILHEEEEKLRDFFRIMETHIPKSFFDSSQPKIEYTSIAYDHYCDALLEKGVIERKIADVVMSLEALFLNEDLELGYRLKLRVAKFFGLMEYDPYKIKDTIKDAYRIRSIFAHGNILSYKEKRKYESKYGDLKNLLLQILEDHYGRSLVSHKLCIYRNLWQIQPNGILFGLIF